MATITVPIKKEVTEMVEFELPTFRKKGNNHHHITADKEIISTWISSDKSMANINKGFTNINDAFEDGSEEINEAEFCEALQNAKQLLNL